MAGISITLEGNFAALTELRNRVRETSADIAKGFSTAIGSKMFEGVLAGLGAIPGAVKEAIEAGDKLNRLVAKTGAEAEKLIILEQVFKNVGVEGDEVGNVLNEIQNKLSEVNDEGEPTSEIFERMGVSMVALKKMDAVDAFNAIATALRGIKDPAEKAFLMAELLGDVGWNLLPAVDNAASFDEAASKLGLMPRILTENADKFSEITGGVDRLSAKFKELAFGIAEQLAPAILDLINYANEISIENIISKVELFVDAINKASSVIKAFLFTLAAVKITSIITALSGIVMSITAVNISVGFGLTLINQAASAAAATGKVILAALSPVVIVIAAATAVFYGLSLYTEALAKKNDALTDSFKLGADAAKKFNIQLLKTTLTSPEGVQAEIDKVTAAKSKLIEDTQKLRESTTSTSATNAINKEEKINLKILDTKITQLRSITQAQMDSNLATANAAKAAIALAAAEKAAAAEYDKARQKYADTKAKAAEKEESARPLEKQLENLKKKEAEVRAGFSEDIRKNYQGSKSQEIVKAAEEIKNPIAKKDAQEQANKLQEVEIRRSELLGEIAKKKAEEAKVLAEATAEYDAELTLLNAQIEGGAEKVKQLEKEVAIREQIATLVAAGVDPEEAVARAATLEAAKAGLPASEARRNAARISEDATAIGSESKQAELQTKRRSQELQDSGNLGKDEADNIAAREAALTRLTALSSKQEGLQATGGISATSSLQRVGGGGVAVSSGLDYARQSADLQRDMVKELRIISTHVRPPAEE